MSPFNLADYEPVEDRLRSFWADHPKGRIETELVRYSEGIVVIKALVWRSDKPAADATGFAQEKEGSSPVNRTSALENCETSAIGRALANLGYAAKGKRPSREEMSKAESTPVPPVTGNTEPSSPAGTSPEVEGDALPTPLTEDHFVQWDWEEQIRPVMREVLKERGKAGHYEVVPRFRNQLDKVSEEARQEIFKRLSEKLAV